jgi:uncharacterized membrane protein YbhN (UPF0104 family)
MLWVLEKPIGFWLSLNLTFSGQLLNYLPLRPGTLMQAVILKKESSLNYSSYASMFTARVLVVFVSAGILGVFGLVFSGAIWQRQSQVLTAFFAAATVLPMLVFFIPRGIAARRKGPLGKALFDFLSGWEMLRRHWPAMLGSIGMAMVAIISTGMRMWLCFVALKLESSFVACITFAAIIQFVFLVSITPDGLGLREILVAGVAAIMGFTYEHGMFASSLEHGITIIVTALTGLPSLLVILYGRRRRLAADGKSDIEQNEQQ